MASKSVGQIVGTVVGAAIGFFAGGNVALGASIGGMVGGLIDPPKGPTVVGPRLDDLSFQTSTLGAPLGRAYGTVPILGNVVWLEGDKYREVITSEEQGGKGGSSATYETAHYYATFAVSLLRIPDATRRVALRKLWIGSNLVYDAGSDNIESVIASNSQSSLFTFYSGSDDQQPNPRWQADKGINAVSGFPGRCYIVIYDLDLEPYSRSLAMAQVKVELTEGDAVSDIDDAELILPQATDYWTGSMMLSASGAQYTRVKWHPSYACPVSTSSISLLFSDSHDTSSAYDYVDIYGGTRGYHSVPCCDTDALISVAKEIPGSPSTSMSIITVVGGMQTRTSDIPDSVVYNYGLHSCCYRSGEGLYLFNGGYSEPAFRVTPGGAGVSVISAGSYQSRAGGLSENYLFLVHFALSGSTTTIYRLNKSDLSLDETWTASISPYNTAIQVVNDETVYTAALGHVHKWVSGAVVADLGALVPFSFGASTIYSPGWFKVFSEDPGYVVSWNAIPVSGLGDSFIIGHDVIGANVAKLRDIVTSECGLAGLSSGDLDLTGLTDSDVRGFRIAQAGPVRSSLEMLQAAFPFDVAPSGYKLRFVSRGGTSLTTIPETSLGAVSGGSSTPVLLPVSREMDTQIPYKVSVRYLDPAREYDIGEQYASRPDTASVSERTVELSLVMTADEAARTADVLNHKDWLERVSFGPFSLPPTYRNMEPPDVVTIEHRGQSHEVRLVRGETLPDGRVEYSALPSKVQTYTSSAVAQESLTVGQSLVPLTGSTSGYLLDIPRIRTEQDVPGMVFAMTGLTSGWPGGVLLRSDDSGNTYNAVGGSTARAKVFVAGAALSAHHGYSIDHASVLTVTPRYTDHTLSGISEDQLYAHVNLAAYGADGRWEVVAFKTAVDNTGSYTVQNFLRGLYGTEWASGLHVAGDYFILLDTATVRFFGLPTSAIGSQRLYRAVTQGAALDSSVDTADTYDAVNLLPLSPVEMRGWRDPSTKDWTLLASRRTRTPVEIFSGLATPLGETAESYDIEIWDSGFTTLKRTFSGLTTPGAVYTGAQQITDFGSVQSTIYYKIYQISSVVGRGYPLTGSITRVVSEDPYIDLVKLLAHMDDVGLTDYFSHAVTLYGSVTRSSTQYKFGGYSASLNGTTQYFVYSASPHFNLWAGNVTAEAFIYFPSYSTNQVILEIGTAAGNRISLCFISSQIVVYSDTGGSGGNRIAASPPSINTWHHVAITRNGTTVTLWVDGSSFGTSTTSFLPSGNLAIAVGADISGGSKFTGYVEELRYTAACRYTATFTPPTQAFPNE